MAENITLREFIRTFQSNPDAYFHVEYNGMYVNLQGTGFGLRVPITDAKFDLVTGLTLHAGHNSRAITHGHLMKVLLSIPFITEEYPVQIQTLIADVAPEVTSIAWDTETGRGLTFELDIASVTA